MYRKSKIVHPEGIRVDDIFFSKYIIIQISFSVMHRGYITLNKRHINVANFIHYYPNARLVVSGMYTLLIQNATTQK